MGLFRKRDFAVAILIAIAIYLSYFETPGLTYSVDPAWFIEQSSGQGGQASRKVNYKVLPPIVTDLEGDGVNEVIVITSDLKLKVFNADIPAGDNTEVYHPEEVYAVELPNTHKQGHIPVAMKTGYTTPYSTTDKRSQVIVVLFEDWTVNCYDSSLHLLWTKEVAHKTFDVDHLIKYFRIDSASLYIAPLQLKEFTSAGTVIVGARMVRREALEGVSHESEAVVMRQLSEGTHPEAEAVAKLGHFSIFALDSDTGHVLWKHDGTEMRSEQYSRSLPQHAYTLDLKDLMTKTHHAAGINDWTVFRQSLVDELPHTWTGAEHTSMRIAHFVRRHIGASVGPTHRVKGSRVDGPKKRKGAATTKRGEHADTSAGKGRNGRPAVGLSALPLLQGEVKSPSLSKAATLPHNAAEHVENPNVIVVHTEKGLEVIALRTGIPITSLALPEGKVYADVDGDGVIDTIVILDSPRSVNTHRAEFAHHQYEFGEGLQHCMLLVMSGLPARSQLFNGTVCAERPSLRESFSDHSGERHMNLVREPPSLYDRDGSLPDSRGEHPTIAHAIPLVLRKLDATTGKESRAKEVIVAIHSGVVTSYSGKGNFNWQIRTAPMWSTEDAESAEKTVVEGQDAAAVVASNSTENAAAGNAAAISAAVVGFDSDADRAEGLGGHDTVYSNILIIGESEMQLVSREGETLTHALLPKPPVAPPVLGDFDNDGVSDIIIITDGAILGYHVHVVKGGNVMLTALISLAAIAALVFILHIQRVPPPGASRGGVPAAVLERQSASAATTLSGNTQPRVPRSKAGLGSVFHIARSTDDHLD